MELLIFYLIGLCVSGLLFCIATRMGDVPPRDWEEEWPIFFFFLITSWFGVLLIMMIILVVGLLEIAMTPTALKVKKFLTKERPITNLFRVLFYKY